MRKDRSGIWLLLAGILLILSNKAGPFPFAVEEKTDIQGQTAVTNVIVERTQMRQDAAVQEPKMQRPAARDQTGQRAVQEQSAQYAEACGYIRIAGSSSMERYISALVEGFMGHYPDITVTVQFTGSSAGIAAVAAGSADIGISSRYLKEAERAAGVTEYVAGFDGIALCGNPANGVSGITRDELCAIYTGEIRSWTELGGCNLPVVAVGREAGSGTRDAFEELLDLEGGLVYANELDSTGAVMARILATPGAIGYVSFETVGRVQKECVSEQEVGSAGGDKDGTEDTTEAGNPEVRRDAVLSVLYLDGTQPSLENVRNGSYPLCRPFVMAVKGELSSQNSLVQAWFDYVDSEEGRKIAEQAGVADCAFSP